MKKSCIVSFFVACHLCFSTALLAGEGGKKEACLQKYKGSVELGLKPGKQSFEVAIKKFLDEDVPESFTEVFEKAKKAKTYKEVWEVIEFYEENSFAQSAFVFFVKEIPIQGSVTPLNALVGCSHRQVFRRRKPMVPSDRYKVETWVNKKFYGVD